MTVTITAIDTANTKTATEIWATLTAVINKTIINELNNRTIQDGTTKILITIK